MPEEQTAGAAPRSVLEKAIAALATDALAASVETTEQDGVTVHVVILSISNTEYRHELAKFHHDTETPYPVYVHNMPFPRVLTQEVASKCQVVKSRGLANEAAFANWLGEMLASE